MVKSSGNHFHFLKEPFDMFRFTITELKYRTLGVRKTWRSLLSLLPLMSHLCQSVKGDSTLRTLHSDTKINILNPNLNVKKLMFNKGVQTNIENTFSVPFPPNKKML